MALSNLLSNDNDIQPQVALQMRFLTDIGLFRLLILMVCWLIKRAETRIALYHRIGFVKVPRTYRYKASG